MKKIKIPSSITRKLGKVCLTLKKHSPEILVAAGVVGTVTSTVMACKATTKVSTILDKAKEDINTIHEVVENPEMVNEEYTVEDSKKDLAIVYAQTGVQLVKLYAPSVILGTASLACILTSHKILRKRNFALAAAYATIDKSFKDYRGRLVERFGEELDKELRYNIKAKEIEEIVQNEDGTESIVKNTVQVIDHNPSDYSRFFCEGCKGWSKDAKANKDFLTMQQAYANDKLRLRGYVFLNEVYEMIGLPKTPEGNVAGWIYDENNTTGDNYISFGIYDQCGVEKYDERKRAFVNGWERSILLDFNVDGNILEMGVFDRFDS